MAGAVMGFPRPRVEPNLGKVRPGYNPGSVGTNFQDLVHGPANAPIKPAKIGMPNRGDYGTPTTGPAPIGDPERVTVDRGGIDEAAANARKTRATLDNPTGSSAFRNIMLGAQARTSAAARSIERESAQAGQRGGWADADAGRKAQQDRMSNLATAGTDAAQMVSSEANKTYGTDVGSFTTLQAGYTQAKATADTAHAQQLNEVHMANATNFLKTFELNSNQQLSFAHDLNGAKIAQGQLDADFNKDLINNAQYIQQSQQVQAQLAMQQAALAEKAHEFDVTANQFEESRADAKNKLDRYGPGYSQNP